MRYVNYSDVVKDDLLVGNIDNNEFQGFIYDYRVLHCLIRKYQPRTFMEIGTNCGSGTNIICNAGKNWLMQVYSLDLPTEECHKSLQHPISEGKGDRVGSNCTFHYKQLRGDSMTFNFDLIRCQGYFIDGEHDYDHPRHETHEALRANPMLIIWHDADVPDVWRAILDSFDYSKPDMDLFRVTDTRIAYAVKKNQ